MKVTETTRYSGVGPESRVVEIAARMDRSGSPAIALHYALSANGRKYAAFVVRGADLVAHMHEALAAYEEGE